MKKYTFLGLENCKFRDCTFSCETILDLSIQELKEIPKYVFSLHFLTKLFLIGNQISNIPKEIDNLVNLKYLWLLGNNFSEFHAQALHQSDFSRNFEKIMFHEKAQVQHHALASNSNALSQQSMLPPKHIRGGTNAGWQCDIARFEKSDVM